MEDPARSDVASWVYTPDFCMIADMLALALLMLRNKKITNMCKAAIAHTTGKTSVFADIPPTFL